jgi:Domain of unknown function (DUF4268)
MMTKIQIGKRTPIQNIRSVWSKENEFSDWLITQEGIELLAEDLGIQIENPVREAKGNNFPCDIVGTLVGEEKHIVVIENQFGRTDHDHLAKLLTHAAVHKAMTGIWIAESVADDHRQVIDWLNENTPETVSLYLAELKAYTIGTSSAGPQLDVICRPNVTMKRKNKDWSESDEKRWEWRRTFWEEIHAHMKSSQLPFRLQKAGEGHWSAIGIGRSDFHIEMLLTPRNKSIVVGLVIQTEWKEAAFEQLKTQAKEIHKELGRELDWRPMPDKQSARILIEEKLDPRDDANRQAVCEWFKIWTPKMFNVFKDRVKALQEP